MTAPNPPAPLQVVYLHQRDAGMIARYRAWANWLAEGLTRAVESELIAMDGGDPATALSRASRQRARSGHPLSAPRKSY